MNMKFFRPFVLLGLALLLNAGCKDDPVTPNDDYGSESAADGFSMSIGSESGGAGATLNDASNLAEGFTIGNSTTGKNGVLERDSSYDPVTKMHTITITRERTYPNSHFTANLTFRYTFYTGPLATADFTKGVTTRVSMSVDGKLNATTPRINTDDTSHADWELTNLGAGGAPPILNGTYWRSGIHTLTTAMGGKQVNVEQTINFTDDELHREHIDSPIYLIGTATSHYTATGENGLVMERNINITFNGDGTATLAIVRVNGQGHVDSCEVDVRRGRFRRWLNH